MSTRNKIIFPKTKGSRLGNKVSSRRQPVYEAHTPDRRVVIFETMHAAQEVIRISIETASHARQPERIIAF
jgi:hypothetical protein